jgi:hypothetical protein
MDLKTLTAVGDETLAVDNIWTAIEVLTNRLGARVGKHLETLLCKETATCQRPSWWSVLYAKKDCIHSHRYETEEQAREAARIRLAQANLAGELLTVCLMSPDHQLRAVGKPSIAPVKDGL